MNEKYYQELVEYAEKKGWGVNEFVKEKAKNYTPTKITILNEDGTQKETTLDEMFDRNIHWFKKYIYFPLYRFYDKYVSWVFNSSSYERWWQRRTRGWDDSDTWNLEVEIAKYILPRLKRYKEIESDFKGIPGKVCAEFATKDSLELTDEQEKDAAARWKEIVDKMIWSFEFYLDENNYIADQETWDRWQEGMDLFAKYYTGLWW